MTDMPDDKVTFKLDGQFAANPTIVLHEDDQKLVVHLDALREEGRSEVLREIADLDCLEWFGTDDDQRCFFCARSFSGDALEDSDAREDPDQHAPDCLWLRAQAAKA